tara:strand:- start:344 stop:1054 length:711 start_codon:yes stop_codon:yes gene_type:complete
MPRGVTLGQLITDLRSEAGHSLQANLGKATRDVFVNLIDRTQRRLWADYSWPFLSVTRDLAINAGQRYYDLPSDVTFERIERMETKHGDVWGKMHFGITNEHYNQHDSDRGIRSSPIRRYDTYEGNQLEIWPIPAENSDPSTFKGLVRLHGIKNLSALVAEADTADLDDQLILLYAAAELAARQKQGDANNKLAQAQAHYGRLKARMSKTETFVIGGGEPEGMYRPKGPPLIASTG